MTPTHENSLKTLDISERKDVLDLQDIGTFKELNEIATKTKIKNAIEHNTETLELSKEMEKQLSILKNSEKWRTEVPKTMADKEKQTKIFNFLGHGTAIAIAKEIEKKFSGRESKEANLQSIDNLGILNINTLLEKSKNSENLTKNLKIIAELKKIKNPPKGSAAEIVQTNWVQYANAISQYTVQILSEKYKSEHPTSFLKPTKAKDLQWTDDNTGASTAALAFIASQKLAPWKSIPLILGAGLVGKSVHHYTKTNNIQKTANHVFNDTASVIKNGAEFIEDFVTNKKTTTSEKFINGLGSLAMGAGAWWAGRKAVNWITSLFIDKTKSVASATKNKLKEKIPEDSFFGKHWGKLSLLALSAFGLSKIPDGFFGNILNQKGKDLSETIKTVTTDTVTSFGNKIAGKAIATELHSSIAGERDIPFENLKIAKLKSNLQQLQKSEHPPLAEQAKKMLEQINKETNNLSLVDDGKALSSKDFKLLATQAKDAGFQVSIKKVERNNTYTLSIGNLTFAGLPQDVVKHNDAIEKTEKDIDKYRNEDKATLITQGMDRLIAVIQAYTKENGLSNESDKAIKIAKEIKRAVKKSGPSGFTTELYKELILLRGFSEEKEGAALMFSTGDGEKYAIGIVPTVSDEIFDKYADEINKSTMSIVSNSIRNLLNDVVNTTMEQLTDTDTENDPVYKLLQEYQSDIKENGEKKFITPEFFLDLGSAILERNKNTIGEYDSLEIAVDAGKAYIIFQGKLIWSTAETSVVNLLWKSWGTDENGNLHIDEDAIAKGASPLLLIGGVKAVNNIIGTGNPGLMRTALQWGTTKPMVFTLYDTPKFLLKHGFKALKALKGEKARKIYKGMGSGLKTSAKFLGNGSVIIDKFSNPEKIQAKILAKTEKLLAEKVQIEGNPKKIKRIAKIDTLLEKLEKRWEETQKKLKKIHDKKLEAEEKILQQEKLKLKTLTTERNESLNLSEGDSKITKQKEIIQTQIERVEEIKARTFSTLTEEQDILLQKSEKIELARAKKMGADAYIMQSDKDIKSLEEKFELEHKRNFEYKNKTTSHIDIDEEILLKEQIKKSDDAIENIKEKLKLKRSVQVALDPKVETLRIQQNAVREKIANIKEEIKNLAPENFERNKKALEKTLEEFEIHKSQIDTAKQLAEKTAEEKRKFFPTNPKIQIAAIDDELAMLVEREKLSEDPTEIKTIQEERMELVAKKKKLIKPWRRTRKVWDLVVHGKDTLELKADIQTIENSIESLNNKYTINKDNITNATIEESTVNLEITRRKADLEILDKEILISEDKLKNQKTEYNNINEKKTLAQRKKLNRAPHIKRVRRTTTNNINNEIQKFNKKLKQLSDNKNTIVQNLETLNAQKNTITTELENLNNQKTSITNTLDTLDTENRKIQDYLDNQEMKKIEIEHELKNTRFSKSENIYLEEWKEMKEKEAMETRSRGGFIDLTPNPDGSPAGTIKKGTINLIKNAHTKITETGGYAKVIGKGAIPVGASAITAYGAYTSYLKSANASSEAMTNIYALDSTTQGATAAAGLAELAMTVKGVQFLKSTPVTALATAPISVITENALQGAELRNMTAKDYIAQAERFTPNALLHAIALRGTDDTIGEKMLNWGDTDGVLTHLESRICMWEAYRNAVIPNKSKKYHQLFMDYINSVTNKTLTVQSNLSDIYTFAKDAKQYADDNIEAANNKDDIPSVADFVLKRIKHRQEKLTKAKNLSAQIIPFAETAILQFGYEGEVTEENIKNFFSEEKAETQGIYWDKSEKEWNINIKGLLSIDQEIEFRPEIKGKKQDNKKYFREIFETLAKYNDSIYSSEHESFLDVAREKTDMRKRSEETSGFVAQNFIKAYLNEVPKIKEIMKTAKTEVHLGLIISSILHEYKGPDYTEESLKKFFTSKKDVSSTFARTVPTHGIFWNAKNSSWNVGYNKKSEDNISSIITMLKNEKTPYLSKNNKLTLWGMQYAKKIFPILQKN